MYGLQNDFVQGQNMLSIVLSPDFLKKCQIQPNSWDQWQLTNFILESESTHQIGIVFDGIMFGWVFWLLKDLFHNVYMVKDMTLNIPKLTKKFLFVTS